MTPGTPSSVVIHEVAPDAAPLSAGERRALAVQLTLAMLAADLLLVSFLWRLIAPDDRDLAELIAALAAAVVAVPVARAAWHSLREPDLHGVTDQLLAVAVLAAWAVGDLTTAALLPIIMMVGHVLEERSILGSQEAIRALGRLTRGHARRLMADGSVAEVGADQLQPGDLIEVRPGDRAAADGTVIDGRSSVDLAAITGESVPVEIGLDDNILAGAVNLDGRLLVRVTRTGEATALGRITALMQSAERAKPPLTRLLERFAGRYRTLALMLAAGTWLATGDAPAMLAMLVASCPCALVMAAPATAIAAIATAGRHGILLKGAAFIEQLASVDSIILDKTGTLTLGALDVTRLLPAAPVDERTLLRVAGSLGAGSSHPVSRALAALVPYDERFEVEELRELQGFGVTGSIEDEACVLGRPELFASLNIATPPFPDHDGPIAGTARDGRFAGWLLFADRPRDEARTALDELRALGLSRQILLTGDRASVAARVAETLDIQEVCAEALPEQKLARVKAEVAAGYRPLVVGDGINDVLALKAGAVGIAMGAQGSASALASADVVLMSSDLRRLGTCIRLSRRCRQTIRINVAIGLGWTVALTALAAAGTFGESGALLAAVLHNVSTLIVVGNAGRLLHFQNRPEIAT